MFSGKGTHPLNPPLLLHYGDVVCFSGPHSSKGIHRCQSCHYLGVSWPRPLGRQEGTLDPDFPQKTLLSPQLRSSYCGGSQHCPSPSKGPLRLEALPNCEAYLTEPSTPVSPGHSSSRLFPFPHTLTYNPTTCARPFQCTHSFSCPLIFIIFMSLHSQFIELEACTHPPTSSRSLCSLTWMRSCTQGCAVTKSPQVAAFVLIESHLHVFNSSTQDPFSWPLRGREFSRGHTSTLCWEHTVTHRVLGHHSTFRPLPCERDNWHSDRTHVKPHPWPNVQGSCTFQVQPHCSQLLPSTSRSFSTIFPFSLCADALQVNVMWIMSFPLTGSLQISLPLLLLCSSCISHPAPQAEWPLLWPHSWFLSSTHQMKSHSGTSLSHTNKATVV